RRLRDGHSIGLASAVMTIDDFVLPTASSGSEAGTPPRPARARPRVMPLVVNAGAGAGAARDAAEAAEAMLSAAGIETRRVLVAPGADLTERTLALLQERPDAITAAGG